MTGPPHVALRPQKTHRPFAITAAPRRVIYTFPDVVFVRSDKTRRVVIRFPSKRFHCPDSFSVRDSTRQTWFRSTTTMAM
jgi:hypothetical protein